MKKHVILTGFASYPYCTLLYIFSHRRVGVWKNVWYIDEYFSAYVIKHAKVNHASMKVLSIEMDLAEEISFKRSLLKGEAQKISPAPPSCESPLKFFSASFFIEWLFGTQLPIAHTAPAAAFVLHHTVICKGALNKSGTSFQMLLWKSRQEHIKSVCGFFSSRLAI